MEKKTKRKRTVKKIFVWAQNGNTFKNRAKRVNNIFFFAIFRQKVSVFYWWKNSQKILEFFRQSPSKSARIIFWGEN